MNKKHESWFKALSFLCILSLVLSLIPPVGIWQSVKADDVTLYNGGLDSYNGLSYTEWAKKAGVKPTLDVTINGTTKTLHFNSEIYAERGQVVYGEPDDVPANHLVSPAGFKPAPDGYFYAVKQSNGSYRLALPGTAGAVRGWFRYLGYSMSKAPFSDPRFPPDYTPEVITPDKLVPISSVPASAKDALGLTGYDPSKVSPNDWQLLFQNLYLLKEYDSGTNQTLKQLLVDSGKVTSWTGLSTYVAFLGVDQNNNASARIIWKDSTGRLRYRTYSGFIPQGGSPKVTTEGVGGSIVSGLSFVSGSSTSTIAGAVLRYDPAKTDKPAVNIYIDGKLEDDLGSHYVEPYYDRMTLTRNDVQTYQTRIVNITINGQSAINSEITKWRDAIVIGQDSNTVSFRTEVEGRYFEIPTSLLKPGNNNVVVTGETRVVFDTGNGTKTVVSENTATMSFTIKVDVNLQPPQLQLSVTPSQSTITITNGQYSPSQYVTHNISAKVTVPSLPAGYQITAMEFYIDTSNPPAGNVISKTITNGLATNYSFDSIKTFQYDASKIPLKTDGTGQGTPAYYGKVRYQLQSISNPSQTQWSGWSSVAWTKAEVDVKATGGIVTADLTADKTSISGKEGDKVTVVLTTNATLSNKPAGTKVTQWKIYLRESNETQPNPIATTSNDQNTFSASRNYTFTLKSGMTSIKFVTRAYCTLSNGTTLNGYDDITIPVSITTPQQDQQPGEVICDGVISPQTAQATKNPFTGQIDPPTTDVQVGVSASISSTGGKK
ncbi:hypothetical protein OTK01_000368 [Caldicellulosiruptor acetigenus]|uniref:Athe_2463 domain-containing protein n=1 Tax=Caldicellulosiruptor acetigenus TaxID=301953 RepID=UPI0022A93C46|nr:hypothetical protein [Caldicellulosiruptor acetigenus]WAM36593.1 hypothetical protein OTK01_000368 [Caldicellulosiruptor acetigenus]